MIKNFLLKKPYSVSITITSKCNSRCVYCNFWKTKNPKHLDLIEFEKIMKKSRILQDVKQFSLTGGEPFLHPNIEGIIDIILKYAKPVKISIVTNGLLVEVPEVVRRIVKKYGRKKFRMKVSLDGTREYYKKTRGVDGYNIVVKNIEELSKIVDVSIGFTITDHNHEDLGKISEMFKDRVIAHPVEEIGYYGSTSNTTRGLPKLTHKNPVFKVYYAYLRKAMRAKKRIHKCYAGTLSLCINQDLDVFSCIKAPVAFGNIKENNYDFDKLWKENIKRVRKKVDTAGCYCFCTGDTIPSILRDLRWLRFKK